MIRAGRDGGLDRGIRIRRARDGGGRLCGVGRGGHGGGVEGGRGVRDGCDVVDDAEDVHAIGVRVVLRVQTCESRPRDDVVRATGTHDGFEPLDLFLLRDDAPAAPAAPAVGLCAVLAPHDALHDLAE